MGVLSCRVPAPAFFASNRGYVALMCAAMAAVTSVPSHAHGQAITTTMLIGDAVDTTAIAQYTDIDEAIKRFINRDVLAARQFLESAKKKNPGLPPVDLLLAKMYFLGGNAP